MNSNHTLLVLITLLTLSLLSCDKRRQSTQSATNDVPTMQAQIINISPTGSSQLASQVTAVVADAQQVSQKIGSLVTSLATKPVAAIDNNENPALKFFNDPDGWKRLSDEKQIMQWAYDAFHSAARALATAPLLLLTNSSDRSVALQAYNLLGVESFRNGDVNQTREYFRQAEYYLGIREPLDRERIGIAATDSHWSSLESLWHSRAKLACETSTKDKNDNEVYWYTTIIDCLQRRGVKPESMGYQRAWLACALMRAGERKRAIEQLTVATQNSTSDDAEWLQLLDSWHKGSNNTIWDSL